jgi:hypothetical protein
MTIWIAGEAAVAIFAVVLRQQGATTKSLSSDAHLTFDMSV